MRKLVNFSFLYMILGVASGLFYREFTKINRFPEGQWTQLSVVHTHLLILGFIMLIVVLLLEKAFELSNHRKLFAWFMGTYNAGVILTAGMQLIHGIMTVLEIESSAMISGIAGLGHMSITAGMVLLFVMLHRTVGTRTGRVQMAGITEK
ncbi:DUF2871 domain-containing protein [Glutamicibacter sp. JL.03c]|uniref:DUF2871 domain-containing protein n=1 Tax=Glutamicibacter sp. JL.03c TaxID=2984842 RepID=UPI0021F7BADC|nr:DUF2871 domain-containing protein [Glutamicibacter sp. JL.03c]UYQ76165.1 DUF2871 domain-containing protein [Glutamicibacter sp. JL.03c]